MHPAPFVFLLSAALLPSASAAEVDPSSTDPAAFAPRTEVLFDVATDGVLWAKGATYKMSFSRDGAAYRPAFGKRATQSRTLDVSFARATVGGVPLAADLRAEPRLDGTTVVFDRGTLLERYDLALAEVEQSFVIPHRPGPGDLLLRLGGGTDLEYRGRDQGLRFEHPGVGDVRYGDVVVIDRRGRRWSFESSFVDGAVELRVPGAVLAAARYPLVIDPVILAVPVDGDGEDDEDPDVAFSTTSNTYLVVYEEVVASNDRDVIARRFDDDGTFLEEVAVDISSADTIDPAVAATSGQFLVVWNELGGLLTDNTIRARSRAASGTQQGAPFDVSTGARDEAHPDVGGSSSLSSPTPFLVVWDEKPLLAPRRVRARLAGTNGQVSAEIVVHSTTNDESLPRVTKDSGASGRWVVAFEQDAITVRGLIARGVRTDGSLVPNALAVDTHAPGISFGADVDGDGDTFLVVYEDPDSNDPSRRDVLARALGLHPSGNLVPTGQFNVSKLAISNNESVDQFAPCVAAEGCRYTVAYLRPSALGDHDVRATSFAMTGPTLVRSPVLVEDEFTLAGLLSNHREVAACSTRFDEPGQMFVTWTRQVAIAEDDVEAKLVSALADGGVQVVQTGCGTVEPVLFTTAVPAVGSTFGLLTGNFVSPNPLLFIGPPLSVPMCPSQAGCILGADPQIQLTIPSFVLGVLPCDGALLGLKIAVQGIDLLPAQDQGPSCGPPFFGPKFRVSDTLVLTLQ